MKPGSGGGASSLLRFLAPLALMGLIFYLSHQPNLSTGLGTWDLILRKLAHIGSYALLTLLWFRALFPHSRRAQTWAAVISLLYAVSDEYHQTFIEGRRGSPIDVLIDGIGVTAAALLIRSGRIRRFGPDRR